MPKIFMSLPMRGYTDEEIYEEMQWMKEIFDRDIEGDYELIDSVFEDVPPDGVIRDSNWYLGKSIAAMSEADIVLFHPNWREARGCLIEHMICALYEIPYIELAKAPEEIEADETEKEAELMSDDDNSQEKLTLI